MARQPKVGESMLKRIARQELGKKPKLGDVSPCMFCNQPLTRVESYDIEHLLQTGELVKSNMAWIHAGPTEAANCRRVRENRRRGLTPA